MTVTAPGVMKTLSHLPPIDGGALRTPVEGPQMTSQTIEMVVQTKLHHN
jgi:hypothetical protein